MVADFFDSCTKDEIISQWQDAQARITELEGQLEEELARADAGEKERDELLQSKRAGLEGQVFGGPFARFMDWIFDNIPGHLREEAEHHMVNTQMYEEGRVEVAKRERDELAARVKALEGAGHIVRNALAAHTVTHVGPAGLVCKCTSCKAGQVWDKAIGSKS